MCYNIHWLQPKVIREKNIKSIALTSQLSQEEIIRAFDNLQFGDFKFLYLSPEKLQSPFIQDKIKQDVCRNEFTK